MFTLLLAVVLASSATCTLSQDIKQNAPTHVPTRCFLDKAHGPCRDYRRNYYFNVTAGHCQTFVYGGCGGNWNRFATHFECHRTCTCATPPETGPCRGHIRRWFYSPTDKCCRPFIYGGCGGNSNSYATWTECSEMCGYPTADSSWWTWGAQWGNWSSGQSNGVQPTNRTYTRNDFMRDWMLWSLLSGGEGFEMENLASIIGRAHILGLGQSGGSFGGGRGTFGFGSQMFGQEAANGFGAGLEGGMQGSGMSNMGPAYQVARPGSFTPLGQVGSAANMMMMMNGEASEMMAGANAVWNQLEAAGLVGGTQNWGTRDQSNWGSLGQSVSAGQRQGWSGAIGGGMSGQGDWGHQSQRTGSGGGGQGRWIHREGRWNTGGSEIKDILDIGSGALGYRGAGQTGSWNTQQTGSTTNSQGVGNTAIEILHLIGQIGRGALGPSDLINLGHRYGAIGPSGNVDINLLATKLVSELHGPKGEVNMAHLKGVAQRLGALDSNGNINIPLMVKGITESLSSGRFSNTLGGLGIPTLDEFQWLGSGKRSIGSSSGGGNSQLGGSLGVGSTGGGPLVGREDTTGIRLGTTGVGGRPLSGGGSAGSRLDVTGLGEASGIKGGAVGGIHGAVRGIMSGGGAGGAAGGVSGMGTGIGESGVSGTRLVQTVNVAGGSRRMGSYGKR